LASGGQFALSTAAFSFYGSSFVTEPLVQTELRECLLLFGPEFSFSHLLSKNIKIKVHVSVM
jgi:hypothetical protein